MRKVRRVIGAVTFGLLALVSAAAAVEVWRIGIPETTVDDPAILVRELASEAYLDREFEMKERLARRIELEFVRGADWQPAISQLSDEEWKRFDANFSDLTWIWINQKVHRYSRLRRDGEKRRYLEQQMARVRTWPLPRRKPRRDGRSAFDIQDQLIGIMGRIGGPLRSLPPEERARFEEFGKALGMHFASRMQAAPD